MRRFLLMFIFFISNVAFCDDLQVEVHPSKPVTGETFQALFKIYTDSQDVPEISFDRVNLKILGKSNQGVSTRTVYANGKLTVTRAISVAYDLVAPTPGFASLQNIKVKISQKILRHPVVNLRVLKEPEELADVFVMADTPKTDLVKGEGIVVRYYLYSKVPVSSLDVKKYPKLNGFLKRFIPEAERTERVSVDGQIYLRTQIYAAKLFAEKTGNLKIDPLYLAVTYPHSRGGSPFGSFGLNQGMKTKSIKSKPITIKVDSLPGQIPQSFTGLIGKHEFQLQVSKTKLIVNEPLEVKLSVSGPGAMESLEAPKLIDNEGLEVFEINGDLKVAGPDQATKIFDYTYLAKKNTLLPEKKIELSYFDPSTNQYVTSSLNIPEITIAGEAIILDKPKEMKNTKNSQLPSNVPKTDKRPLVPDELFGIITKEEKPWKRWLPEASLGLALLTFFISLFMALGLKPLLQFSHGKLKEPSSFKKGGFSLSDFYQWINPLIEKTGKSPGVIIKEAPFSDETKKYFMELLAAYEQGEYSSQKNKMNFKYDSRHFRSLRKYIESLHHENT